MRVKSASRLTRLPLLLLLLLHSLTHSLTPLPPPYMEWLANHSLTRFVDTTSSEGAWTPTSLDTCTHTPVCVSDTVMENVTWTPTSTSTSSNFFLYNHTTSCERVRQWGYSKIYLVGDSFTRHIYQALLLIFSNDYTCGSLNNPHNCLNCGNDMQFAESKCSGIKAQSRPYRSVCQNDNHNDTIQVSFFDAFNFKWSPDRVPYEDPGVLLIWSEGSHPPFFNYMTHTPHVSI